jgi:hypothetical protein
MAMSGHPRDSFGRWGWTMPGRTSPAEVAEIHFGEPIAQIVAY